MILGKWFWNVYARCYDTITALKPYQMMVGDIIHALDLKPGMRILDAGCGTGNLEMAILKTGVPVEIVAVDFSEAMLAQARKKVRSSQVSFMQLDLMKPFPFSTSSFDAVVCNNVLYALPNPWDTYTRLMGLLHPHGAIVVGTPRTEPSIATIVDEHRKRSGIVSLLRYMPALFLVGLFNLLIVRFGNRGVYHFFSEGDIKQAARPSYLRATYADQCWLWKEVSNGAEDRYQISR